MHVIKEAHSSHVSGNFCVGKIVAQLQRYFYWPRMNETVAKFIQRIQNIHEAVKDQLEKIQAKYKMCHDKHRVDHYFQVGDQVWL